LVWVTQSVERCIALDPSRLATHQLQEFFSRLSATIFIQAFELARYENQGLGLLGPEHGEVHEGIRPVLNAGKARRTQLIGELID